jgi:hypothetical protein
LISPVSTVEYPEVQLCMKPGDLAVHHVETVHRSGPNRTDRSRRQLGLGYRSSLAKANEQAKAQYHKDLQTLHAATK